MAMRLVWPDEETMPKKRKAKSAVEESEQLSTDEAVDAPDTPTERDTLEAQDGPVESAESQEPAEEAEEENVEEVSIDVAILEALLFSTHHPLTGQRLAELLETKSQKSIRTAVVELNKLYQDSGRTFRVEQVAGGYQLLSLPEYGDILKRLHQREADSKLSKAALETLAIIAYKQPILRADVEAIRGVACGETIRSLMEKHLVNIAGRAEEPGRPILYGTTKRFLQLFGLNNLKDLPQSEELPKPRE
jgi:segregation and condensation protein B